MAQARLIDGTHISYESTRGALLTDTGRECREMLRSAVETGQAIALTLAPGETRIRVLNFWSMTARRMGLRVQSRTQPDGTLGLLVARREVPA